MLTYFVARFFKQTVLFFVACLKEPELLMIHQNSTQFYNRIAYDNGYSGLGDTFEEGKRLADVLGEKDVLFMGNHGVMTVAPSVDVAFSDMYYLERAAMFQVRLIVYYMIQDLLTR